MATEQQQRQSWDDKKAVGDTAESLFYKKLCATCGADNVVWNRGKYDSRFDFSAKLKSGEVCTFEVKSDKRSKDTGNHMVEISSDGKDSGITVSQSDYWVVAEKGMFIYFITAEVRRFIQKYETTTSKVEGDERLKVYKLVPLSQLQQIERFRETQW